MYIRWGLFLQRFNYVFKHKSGVKNIVADALNQRMHLLTVLKSIITSFDSLPTLYATNEDFQVIWFKFLDKKPAGDYVIKASLPKEFWFCLVLYGQQDLHNAILTPNGLSTMFTGHT